MKKIICLFVFSLLFSACYTKENKVSFVPNSKLPRHLRKSQPVDQVVCNNSLSDGTYNMLKDLYHRYPRKYSRYQPKRIDQDDFQ